MLCICHVLTLEVCFALQLRVKHMSLLCCGREFLTCICFAFYVEHFRALMYALLYRLQIPCS